MIIILLELSDNNIFKQAFESINRIVDEVMVKIDENGFHVNAIDRSHICFVSLNLSPTVFDEFDCEVAENICIDTEEFMRILKRCKNSDILKLELDDNNLILTFTGDVTRKFKIRLMDIEYNTPNPPELNPPCCVEIESNLLKDCLGDMELFGDVISYTITDEYFIAESTGEFGDSDFKYLHGSVVNETATSSFSIPKLKDILVASKFSSIVEVMLGNDMPVVLRFILDSGDGELRFLLAPRLSEE